MGVPWKEQGVTGELTYRQREVLEVIWRKSGAGESAALRGLAEGVTFGAVWQVVRRLRAKGYLGRGPRGEVVLTDKARAYLEPWG